MKAKPKKIKSPRRSHQVPATSQMLYRMEDRLIHRMDAGFHKMEAKFDAKLEAKLSSEIGSVRSEIGTLRSDVSSLKSDVSSLKSDVSSIKSDLSSVKSEIHRIGLLVEEQNARNKFVLDSYAQIYDLLSK